MNRAMKRCLILLVVVFMAGCVHRSEMPPLAEKKEMAKPILITDVSVFMGNPGQDILEHADILIEKGRILKIGNITDLQQTDYERIDGKGKMVIPGLIDHHIHTHSPGAPPWFPVMPDETLLDRNLSSYLFAGITSVFDMGGPLYEMEALQQRIQSEGRFNPRLIYVGSGLYDPWHGSLAH
jgi:hypothetical protein